MQSEVTLLVIAETEYHRSKLWGQVSIPFTVIMTRGLSIEIHSYGLWKGCGELESPKYICKSCVLKAKKYANALQNQNRILSASNKPARFDMP